MRYQQARSQIRSGDLIALSHYKWASWHDLQVQAVRLFTRSEYSHVGIALVWAERVWIIESVVPLIRLVPLSHFADEGFYHIPLPAMSKAELDFAIGQVGKGQYSRWQAALAGLSKLKVGDDALWECAEFVIAARNKSGVYLGTVATPSAVVHAALNISTLQHIKGM